MSRSLVVVSAGALLALGTRARATDPWADTVVSYTVGTGVPSGFQQPDRALGEPTRYTGVGVYPGAVTPFNPAYMGTELVSIGAGGSLTVRFDEPVTNDAAHPYGIDLLVFGNAGYIDTNYPMGVAGPMFGAGGGRVEVSADGSHWVAVAPLADSAFPTLGYADLTDPYAVDPGRVLTDFTRPVNPAFSPAGHTFAEIVAAYAGSGGGTGIDIGAAGLSSVSFVRISNLGGNETVDIDGLAAVSVPGPGACAVVLAGAMAWLPGRRRR